MTSVSDTPNAASDNANTDDESTAKMIRSMLPIRMQSKVVRGFGRGSSELGIPTANLDCQAFAAGTGGAGCWSVSMQTAPTIDDLPTGIYWGYARILEGDSNDSSSDSNNSSSNNNVYTAAISIGYNPTYGNQHKTVEPHLIAPPTDPRRHVSSCGETVLNDFYEHLIRVSVCGYLRPELPFEGLDKLIQAIKQDIANALKLGTVVLPSSNEQQQQQQQQQDESNNGQDFVVLKEMAQREHAWVAASGDDMKLP
ncbi:hypothetical protein ACA910_006269 [Epithemia clementina (nom. ined.)]